MTLSLRSTLKLRVFILFLGAASLSLPTQAARVTQAAARAGLTVTVTQPEATQIASVITANGSVAACKRR